MSQDKIDWINKTIFEWEYDRNVLCGIEPARVDLKSQNGTLWSIHKPTNHRNVSSLHLFKQAYSRSSKPDFDITISTEDIPRDNWLKPYMCYSTSHTTDHNSIIVPDYTFKSISIKGRYGFNGNTIDEYPDLVNKIIEVGKQPPLTNKAGWCGHAGFHHRRTLVEVCNNPPLSDVCDVIGILGDP